MLCLAWPLGRAAGPNTFKSAADSNTYKIQEQLKQLGTEDIGHS